MQKDYINKNRRGITFVEIVVSLLLLSIAIGAILGAFLIGRASALRAKHRIVAINLCRDKIEAIKGMAYQDVLARVQTPFPDESKTIDTDTGLTGTRRATVAPYGDDDILKVAVEVAWTELNVPLKEILVTLISQH